MVLAAGDMMHRNFTMYYLGIPALIKDGLELLINGYQQVSLELVVEEVILLIKIFGVEFC